MMRFEEWEPIYERILADFGYDRKRDEEAAAVAAEAISRMSWKEVSVEELRGVIEGKDVLVCGAAPCLREELRNIDPFEYVVLAADGATSVVLECGVLPDLIVSDLDGYLPDIIYASRLGAIVVAHAHGDNIDMIRRVLPELSRVLCTTQARPLPPHVHNFGGFTDGDRCVFIAKEFGAASIKLVGFDFEDKSVSATKQRKLRWARRLIEQALRDC